MGLADLLGIADLDCRKVESTKGLKHKLRATLGGQQFEQTNGRSGFSFPLSFSGGRLVWPNSLVRRPPWLHASSVKNKQKNSLSNFVPASLKVYNLPDSTLKALKPTLFAETLRLTWQRITLALLILATIPGLLIYKYLSNFVPPNLKIYNLPDTKGS